jgi:hypothetical protein
MGQLNATGTVPTGLGSETTHAAVLRSKARREERAGTKRGLARTHAPALFPPPPVPPPPPPPAEPNNARLLRLVCCPASPSSSPSPSPLLVFSPSAAAAPALLESTPTPVAPTHTSPPSQSPTSKPLHGVRVLFPAAVAFPRKFHTKRCTSDFPRGCWTSSNNPGTIPACSVTKVEFESKP